MRKKILRCLIRCMIIGIGLGGFGMIFGAGIAGHIIEGGYIKHINTFAIIGLIALIVSAICCWVYEAFDQPLPDLSHIKFSNYPIN